MSTYNQGRGDGYDTMWTTMIRNERGRDQDPHAYFEAMLQLCNPEGDDAYQRGFRDGATVAFETNCAAALGGRRTVL